MKVELSSRDSFLLLLSHYLEFEQVMDTSVKQSVISVFYMLQIVLIYIK